MSPALQTLISAASEQVIDDQARELLCLQPQTAFRTDINTNGVSIDFSGPMLLGIPNPMEFRVNTSEWEVSNVMLNEQHLLKHFVGRY